MPPTPHPQHHGSHLRALYRSLLRELPPRPLSSPSPIQSRIRTSFTSNPSSPPFPSLSSSSSSTTTPQHQLAQAEQYLHYIKSQRMYATLLERYNPGIEGVDEEERMRLTARRVGMEMPPEREGGWGRGGKR